MRTATTLRWIGLALLGIAVAAAVSVTASRLVSQQIGLASQPISAGDALAPASATVGEKRKRHRRLRAQATRHRENEPEASAEAPSEAPSQPATTPSLPSSPSPDDDDAAEQELPDD